MTNIISGGAPDSPGTRRRLRKRNLPMPSRSPRLLDSVLCLCIKDSILLLDSNYPPSCSAQCRRLAVPSRVRSWRARRCAEARPALAKGRLGRDRAKTQVPLLRGRGRHRMSTSYACWGVCMRATGSLAIHTGENESNVNLIWERYKRNLSDRSVQSKTQGSCVMPSAKRAKLSCWWVLQAMWFYNLQHLREKKIHCTFWRRFFSLKTVSTLEHR
jgi:hypothetical protein